MPENFQSNEQTHTTAEDANAGTTTFISDSLVEKQEYNTSSIPSSVVPIRDQTIADFLAKPFVIENSTWSAATSPGSLLNTYVIESYLTSNVYWANKIEGFALIRGTAVIRLMANANPFQSGKLIMSFSPCGAQLSSDTYRGLCRNQLTQQPCVEFDCRDSVAMIKIPYIAPSEFYDLLDGKFGWGKLRLAVLSPLRVGSGGEESLGYTVFIHFEDVELAAPIRPQAGSVPSKPTGKSRPRTTKVVSSSNEAENIVSSGSLSKGLMSVANIASTFSVVPSVGPLAVSCSWVARGLSGVASWFGWSKPESVAPVALVSRRLFNNMANSSGVSNAANMGLIHDNSMEVVPCLVGTDVDEMSFNYLKERKAFVTDFVFTDTNAIGHVLYNGTTNVGISESGTSIVGGTTSVYKSYPPFSYLANHFALWRGSLVMTIKFAKTDFHSGRILVTYTPHFNSPAVPNTYSSTLALREIIDIRCKSEVVLTFPYLIYTNYLGVNTPSGTVQITVLNQLRAPETASSYINCLVYWSAGPDFELACPGFLTGTQKTGVFLPQGGVEPCEDQVIVDEVIGNYPMPRASLDSAALCIGEQFTSVKQLLNRYTPLYTLESIESAYCYSVYPYTIGALKQGPGDGTIVQPALFGDALCSFASGYAFFRGRVNLLMTTVNSTIVSTPSTSMPIIRATISPISAAAGLNPLIVSPSLAESALYNVADFTAQNEAGQLAAFQIFDPIAGAEVSVPYYSRTKMTLIDPFRNINTSPAGPSDPNVSVTYSSSQQIAPIFYRSCADDFQLAYFVGFPPIFQDYA